MMTPNEIREARLALGLSLDQMAVMLGFDRAKRAARRKMADDLETGAIEIRPAQERLLRAYLDGYRPDDWPL